MIFKKLNSLKDTVCYIASIIPSSSHVSSWTLEKYSEVFLIIGHLFLFPFSTSEESELAQKPDLRA